MPGAWLTSRLTTAALEQVLGHDLADVVELDVLVEDAIGVDEHHRSDGAGPQAAGLDDLVALGQARVR